jgi:predicted transposase YbfD/YdcC
MRKNGLKGIELGRTVGVEIEGYTGMYQTMTDNNIRHSQMKYDGSLGSLMNGQGIEVVTAPIKQLDLLDEVFEDIVKYKWNVGRGRAGTHIHVDAHDYNVLDRIKMAVFMGAVEKAMFLMVKKTRWSRDGRDYNRNYYCRPISTGWKELLKKLQEEYSDFDITRYKNIGPLHYDIVSSRRQMLRYPNTIRYQFVNIWSSSHDTIEFRLFHSIRTAKDAKLFSLIAYHIVEVVKNSTLEHLEYLADVIMNQSTDANDMMVKFSQAIGLEFIPKIYNNNLATRINRDKEAQRRSVAV